MAVLIPNAGDTTGGNKYAALDQAEPDSLDFEVLGLSSSGVLTGCAVTTNNSSTTVAVSAGVVVLKGVPYVVSAAAALGIPTAPADNRFDVVVARVSGSTVSLVVVTGINSSINPTFPKSASVITGTPSSTTNVNLDTDVVLAALYRSGANTVTSSRIMDKRRIVTTSVFDQGATVPNTGYGNGVGSLYYKTGAPNGTASGLYVKTSDGTWIELAQNVGAHAPIGAAFYWPSTSPVPAGCTEANGQLLSTTTYSALFAVYGYTHGGSGPLFAVPNYSAKIIRCTIATSDVGLAIGSDTVTLSPTNLAYHDHTFAHTHTFSHTHGINHSHPGSNTSSAGTHYHDVLPPLGQPNGLGQSFTSASTAGGGRFWAPSADIPPFGSRTGNQLTTDIEGNHFHNTPQLDYSGSTVSQSSATTANQSPSTTSGVGNGTPFSIIPAVVHSRIIIRSSLGSDPAFTGGGSGSSGQTITTKTTSFTLALADASSLIEVGGAGNMTVTVPPASSVAFPVGSQIDFLVRGNTITYAASGGSVIRSEGGLLTSATQWTAATLKKLTTANEWLLIGKLT